MLDELRTELQSGRFQALGLDELKEWNRRLYQDILPERYEASYGNPSYAVKQCGKTTA